MTNPNDDERLVEFLRQYRPDVPPAAPNLEAEIWQAIASSPQSSFQPRSLRVLPPFRKLATGIAAGFLLAWGGVRLLTPATLIDTASLETFMVNHWDGVVDETVEVSQSDNTETDWLLLADGNNASP